jgi:hypothetical protein
VRHLLGFCDRQPVLDLDHPYIHWLVCKSRGVVSIHLASRYVDTQLVSMSMLSCVTD